MLKNKLILSLFLNFLVMGTGLAQAALQPGSSSTLRLGLRECLERALTNHPLLKAAQARMQGSEELRRYAGVRPNPSITFQTENWRAWQQPLYNFGRDMDIFVYGTQRVETAGKAGLRREVADRQVGVAQAETDLIRRQLQREITRAYWVAVQTQTLLGVIGENRGDLDQLAQYTALRVREGFVAGSELIRVRLEQHTLTAQETLTAQALERAKLDLLKAMGETRFDTRFDLILPDETSAILLLRPLEQLRTEALTKRPELIRLHAEVESARANLKLQHANARTDWEFSAGYKRTGGFNTAIAYVTIPLPLFNKNQGEIGRAAALTSSAEQQLLAEENYVRAEVESAYRSAQKLAEQLKLLQVDFLKQADESRNIALIAYREGATDLYKLLETQRARNEARLLYFRTLQDFQATLTELRLTIGAESK